MSPQSNRQSVFLQQGVAEMTTTGFARVFFIAVSVTIGMLLVLPVHAQNEFKITDGLPTKVLFEVSPGFDDVRIGRGGDSTNERVDADFFIFDPNFTTNPTEPMLFFDASIGDLRLGSGNSVTAADDGDLDIEQGNGFISIALNGSTANLTVGRSTNPGDITLTDTAGSTEIRLDGANGNVTNQIAGNGLVKAWCRVGADGRFDAGFRCNASSAETRSIAGTGTYEVDFTALSTNILARPWVVSCTDDGFSIACEEATAVQRAGDASSLFVQTRNSSGVLVDSAYTIIIY